MKIKIYFSAKYVCMTNIEGDAPIFHDRIIFHHGLQPQVHFLWFIYKIYPHIPHLPHSMGVNISCRIENRPGSIFYYRIRTLFKILGGVHILYDTSQYIDEFLDNCDVLHLTHIPACLPTSGILQSSDSHTSRQHTCISVTRSISDKWTSSLMQL